MAFVQTAFLAGLAALAVPVLVHLLFRRRAKRIDLGTLRFLKVVVGRNTRRRRLKRYVLLTLRLAAVLLLVGLFARPYLLASATGGDDSVLAVLVDTSASMWLAGGDSPPIEQAIERLEELRSRETSRQVELALFDADVRPITSDSPAVPEDSTFSPTDYGRALAWAADRSAASGAAGCEVVILTDLQRTGLDSTAAPLLPADLPVRVIDLGRPVANNLAVTAAVPRRTSVGPGESVTLRATVFNGGPFAAPRLPLVVRLTSGDARRTLRQTIDVLPGETASVEFELPALAAGLWTGSVTIDSRDDLAFDDARHFAVLAAPKDRVLLVGNAESGTALRSDTYFLESALRLARPGAEYEDSLYDARRLATSALPSDLSAYRVVLLANPGPFVPSEARRLRDFVAAGGGLLVFTGEHVTAGSVASLDDAGLTPGKVEGIARATDRPARLTTWETEHPLFSPFADTQAGDLRTLAFDAYTRIAPDKDARILARFGDDPAVLEKRLGTGRVIWFASSADREWGDWTRSGLFLPLVYQMLGRLTGLTDGGPVRAVTLDGSARDDVPSKPGVYARNGYALVANADPRESDLDRCTPEELASKFGLTLADSRRPDHADRRLTGRELRRDELWPWLLIGALGLLLGEGFLSNRTEA